MSEKSRKPWCIAAAVCIFLLFLLTRLYHLAQIPRGIHVDEAGMAFDALCLARYGTDRYGHSWPVYLTNYGAGQSALYAYLAAAAIRLFRFSPAIFRLPAVFGGLLTLIFGSLFLLRTLGRRAALAGGLLITICPYFLMASRWGLDCNLMLGFSVLSLYLLTMAASSSGMWRWALAGLSFGLTLYTYAIAFVAIPLFLLMALFWLCRHRKISLWQFLSFTVPLTALATPLLLFTAFNSGILPPFSTPVITIPLLPEYRGGELSAANIMQNLNLFSMLFSHDFLVYNGFATYGTLYYLSVPFSVAGFCAALTEWKRSASRNHPREQTPEQPLLFFLFLALLLTGLLMSGPNINRLNAIYFPLLYFTVRGILAVCNKAGVLIRNHFTGSRQLSSTCLRSVVALYLILFCFFARYYYLEYPQQIYPQPYFNDSLICILDRIEQKFPGQNREIYVDNFDDNVVHPYIYTLLRRPENREQWLSEQQWDNSYGPYHFNLPDEINPDGIYIMYSNGIAMAALEQAGFQREPYALWWIYYR